MPKYKYSFVSGNLSQDEHLEEFIDENDAENGLGIAESRVWRPFLVCALLVVSSICNVTQFLLLLPALDLDRVCSAYTLEHGIQW